VIKKLLIGIIEIYQKTLSPDSGWFKNNFAGGYCKYTPNCSQYCKEAILKKGIAKGVIMGLWRILRCNPWSHGGHDPIV